MKIRVLSFDFDGCLFHNGYNRRRIKLIPANQPFLDSIKEENQKFDKVITFIGSARQSKEIDDFNSIINHTESSFVAIKTISEYLNASFDNFLMADIYHDLNAGTAFNQATNTNYRGSHHDTTYDHTKFTLLYAQIHKISEQYPDDEILFEFYDDRGCGSITPIDILDDLQSYFTKSPHLLPKNITLLLKHYEGEQVTLVSSIEGTGRHDSDYRNTIKNIKKTSLGWFATAITKKSLKIPTQELPTVSYCASISTCFSSFFQCPKSDRKEEPITIQDNDAGHISLNLISKKI